MENNEKEITVTNPDHDKIELLDINEKVKSSFLNYAMSVIIARALPDARDGLKPVQRRILYGMSELKLLPSSAHKKSARIVGDVMGKYHPHGDSSIYEAMVRMAQDFQYRYPLVDGHGNYGNIDGDSAAAMRYTEARMSKISLEMLRDLDKNTVDFADNYDATEIEPLILPARIPNLLVNGATGIAVGMATNIPPHNLGEVIDGVLALIDNKDLTDIDLMNYIKGPDFPTGGIVTGLNGLRSAYTTGNGSITIRAKCEIDRLKNGKTEIVVTELPYGLNKKRLIERIADVAKQKIIEGITDLRDETNDRKGIRIVIELRKDVNPEVMLNNLYKYTNLQMSYGMNMICLVDNKPISITLKKALEVFIEHQLDVIRRRTKFDYDKAMARIHVLEGIIKAQDHIDEIIKIIRETNDGTEKDKIMERFDLSEIQAQAILDMQLRRLSGLNFAKVIQENKDLHLTCEELSAILSSKEKQEEIIKKEITEIKDKYNNPRKSEISTAVDLNVENEDLIPREDVIITVTNNGYVKRMKRDQYKAQSRGGVGISGVKTHDDDSVKYLVSTNTHNFMMFFTNLGRAYSLKGYQIPEASRTAKGLPLVNIIKFMDGETIAAITPIPLIDDNLNLIFTTKNGIIKKCQLSQFKNIRTNGIRAIELVDGDELLNVNITKGDQEVIIGASNGKAIRFNEANVRATGRSSIGVKAMSLGENDKIIGSAIIDELHTDVLVITKNGYGKRSYYDDYRLQTRGGVGVKTLNVTEKNGALIALTAVNEEEDLIITTTKGMTIRMHVSDIAKTGRGAQGVKLIRLRDEHEIAFATVVKREDEEDISEQTEVADSTQNEEVTNSVVTEEVNETE